MIELPEADLIQSLNPASVLDAGCGTGRVAIELARRGIEAVGIDIDAWLLRQARRSGPDLTWHNGDISRANLRRRFDVVALVGNVMIFLAPCTAQAVVNNMAHHLMPGGYLIAGFQLAPGYLDIAEYDRLAAAAHLTPVARYAGWRRQPWTNGSNYVVALHQRLLKPG